MRGHTRHRVSAEYVCRSTLRDVCKIVYLVTKQKQENEDTRGKTF